jgi:CubicO group peptidase (beta-lactamase class C family)
VMESKIGIRRGYRKMINYLLAIGAVILGLSIFWPKPPELPKSVTSVEELEASLNKLVEFGKPPGMSLVVVKDNIIVYAKGFGWADKPREIAATSESVYHWWSITKVATAIAILQLQEQGKLTLDDTVKTILPFFDVKYPSAESKVITIKHLLTHSSGLPDAGFRIMGWIHHDGEPAVDQTAMVKKVLPIFSTLQFEPGGHAEYTNIGYMVLGAVIEKVSGQKYESYIREHVLQPLAMNHTDFIYTKEMVQYEAAGSHPLFHAMTPLLPFLAASYIREISGRHLWMERVYNDQTPPTGLIGSATDAARLAAACMNGGELDGQHILSSASMSKMMREGYIKKANDTSATRWQGIGWHIYDDKGRFMIKHSGGGPGFSTEMQLYPDEKLGIVLLTNDATCEGWRITNLVASLKW